MRREHSLISLARLCQKQAAMTTNDRTRRELEEMAREYMERAQAIERGDREQPQ
jgi:uncharacterized protein YjiS (DUF1127 family)